LKMLRAIRELGDAILASPQPSLTEPKSQDPAERHQPVPIPAAATPLLISTAIEATGERRYLTVMFCDLVGSTAISAQLDAEEWRDLVGAYDAASAAVIRSARRRSGARVTGITVSPCVRDPCSIG